MENNKPIDNCERTLKWMSFLKRNLIYENIKNQNRTQIRKTLRENESGKKYTYTKSLKDIINMEFFL
jgi:hypothetical protein